MCITKHASKYYYNNKDKVLEKKKSYYDNHKEYYSEQNKKRKSKISDLENEIKQLTEMRKKQQFRYLIHIILRTIIFVLIYKQLVISYYILLFLYLYYRYTFIYTSTYEYNL